MIHQDNTNKENTKQGQNQTASTSSFWSLGQLGTTALSFITTSLWGSAQPEQPTNPSNDSPHVALETPMNGDSSNSQPSPSKPIPSQGSAHIHQAAPVCPDDQKELARRRKSRRKMEQFKTGVLPAFRNEDSPSPIKEGSASSKRSHDEMEAILTEIPAPMEQPQFKKARTEGTERPARVTRKLTFDDVLNISDAASATNKDAASTEDKKDKAALKPY